MRGDERIFFLFIIKSVVSCIEKGVECSVAFFKIRNILYFFIKAVKEKLCNLNVILMGIVIQILKDHHFSFSHCSNEWLRLEAFNRETGQNEFLPLKVRWP